jgi:hypothetical protein
MSRTHKLVALAAAIALAACGERPATYLNLPAPPSIKTFEASRSKINRGEAVTLTWTVEHAENLELLDDQGQKLTFTGTPAEGSAEVTPDRSTFFVLRAKGEGGRDAAFVQVAVGEDLKELFLVAVPPEVNSGQPALLLWSAHRAKVARLQSMGEELTLNAAAGSGSLEVVPTRTQVYTLVASGVDPQETLTRSLELKARPVVEAAAISAGAAKVDAQLTLTWKTRGAGEVVVSEATFGELARHAFPAQAAQVDQGEVSFTVPSTLPSGEPVQDGHPLKFTLQVRQTNPAVTLTRQFEAHVGEGPAVVQFSAPAAVSEGGGFELSWVTRNAARLQLFASGALIYEPLPSNLGKVAQGTLRLPAPSADTTYELRAFSYLGAAVSASQVVRVVKLPVISSFTLPAAVNAMGDTATAAWTTQHAAGGLLRLKNGPTFSVIGSSQVGSGNTQVYPGQDSTVVLEVYNEAGDVVTAERRIAVSGPPAITVGPSPVTTGTTVTVDWDFPAALAASVIGDPEENALKNNPSLDWVDLAFHTGARALHFDDTLNGVVRIPLAFPFRFPFVNLLAENFYVSVNGFVSFQSSAASVSAPLDSASGLPQMLVPFWDDLELGSGEVLWLVEGATFPRRLIVQWNKVRTSVDSDSELTFQVQLLETGETHFIYQTLQGQGADGTTARVGWRAGADVFKDLSTGGALLVEGDELVFFGSGQAKQTWEYQAQRPGAVSPFIRTPVGRYIPFSIPVNVITPGSVTFNEAMLLPDVTAFEGQWIELFNRTAEAMDLSGTVLRSEATETEWTLPAGALVPAGGFLVVGQSTDPLVNGGAPVDVAWPSDFALDTLGTETLTLSAQGAIGTMSWTGAQLLPAESFQAPERAIDSSGQPIACTRSATFGANGAIGTPGAANETCYPYSVMSIPVNYRDISGGATGLFAAGFVDVAVQVSIAQAPFSYFGSTPFTEMRVCNNGWIQMGTGTSTAYANRLLPSTSSQPVGAIAPFWDDLEQGAAGPDSNVYIRRMAPGEDPQAPAGHWIVQWHRLTTYFQNGDDLNFQVKLFDGGAIEFHYGTMNAGNNPALVTGTSATVWLEHVLGTSALDIGRNQGVIQPNTAYRFTPGAP